RATLASAKDEIAAAASWARQRLEQGAKRIGVVVPDLHKRRAEVVRAFSRELQPGYNLPGAARAAMPFNVSLGLALDEYPLVSAALGLLEFSREEISFEHASALIRSPFISGAESEME